jgi:diguanylate cyclase (GGDEF)-like protein
LKKNYEAEKENVIRIILIASLIITSLSICLEIYNKTYSIMTLADISLFFILIIFVFKIQQIFSNKLYRYSIFMIFPLVYFPIAWVNSYGMNGVGLLYFFLFAVIILYTNQDKFGFFTILMMILEVVILILLEKYQFLILSKDLNFYERATLLLFHFPVVGIGTSYIIYKIVKKNSFISEKYFENSIKDFLTDAYNRRYLISYLDELQYEYKLSNEEFFLIFFDVDKLKIINDFYGHDIGDEVLKLFADTANAEITEHDILGRFGGDEFILVVRNTCRESSLELLTRIRESFLNRCKSKFDFTVTISAGVESSIDKSTNDIIRYADQKMYREKAEKHENNANNS